mgnify:CR=1 FL=1
MKYQGNIKIEDIVIGQRFYNIANKKFSTVTNKTANSVELFNLKTSNKGIDCKNWYEIGWFNRLFISNTDGIVSQQLNIIW